MPDVSADRPTEDKKADSPIGEKVARDPTTHATPEEAHGKGGHDVAQRDEVDHGHNGHETGDRDSSRSRSSGRGTGGTSGEAASSAVATPNAPHFVAPSSYLRSRGPASRPVTSHTATMGVGPHDREQIEGLVSDCSDLNAL